MKMIENLLELANRYRTAAFVVLYMLLAALYPVFSETMPADDIERLVWGFVLAMALFAILLFTIVLGISYGEDNLLNIAESIDEEIDESAQNPSANSEYQQGMRFGLRKGREKIKSLLNKP